MPTFSLRTGAVILLAIVAQLPSLSAQGRQGQAQAAPAQTATPAATPAPAPPAQGGRGRGGIAGPGPAIGGEIDETPVVTHHSITVDGKTINYTATVAQMPLKNASGETEAHIFYMAYTLDGAPTRPSARSRSASTAGPARRRCGCTWAAWVRAAPSWMPNGGMPPPPYQMKDNQDTWLDQTDLVFIDPVGTGYSRAKTIEVARRMNGVQGDIQSVGEFMRMYITRNNRELSPLFIAGESYGTFRAAGLAGYLIDRGIAFNGIVLIGTTLNLETIWSRSDDLVYQLRIAHLRRRRLVSQKGRGRSCSSKDLKSFLKEVEGFAMGEYAAALGKGDELSPAERKAVIDKLVRYTGLDAHYLDETNLRWDVAHFTRAAAARQA